MKIAIVNLITRTSLCRHVIPVIESNDDAMVVKFLKELTSLGMDARLFVSDAYKPAITEKPDSAICYLPTKLKRVFLPTRLPFTPSLVGKLKNQFDIVVCSEAFQWATVMAVLAKIISHDRKIKVIVWQELSKHQKMLFSLPSKFFHKVILKFILDRYISAYVPRSAMAARFLEMQGIERRKITHPVSHGYDHRVFFYDPRVKRENYLFSPSRLVESKGIDVLLKAFSLFCRQNYQVNLIIQGQGPLLKEYQAMAHDLGVDKRVTFDTTRLDHQRMRERYQKALLTVICSREDYVIFSVLESIACGTPVVLSTGVDSHVNYLDEKGGMSFENQDHRQLAEILIQTLRDPKTLRRLEIQAVQKSAQYRNTYICRQFIKIFKQN
jgi:1,2-diacylglycerol 3-alpha-glucosyltransferase